MLEYKPRIRNNKAVTSWVPTHDNKNRGQVSAGTYIPPINTGGVWTKVSNLGSNAWSWAAPKYGNGRWITSLDWSGATGNLLTSTDNAVTWSVINLGASAQPIGIGYGNGLWIVSATTTTGSRQFTSTNGTTWTNRSPIEASSSVYTQRWLNGIWIATGGVGSTGAIWSSTDGITWTRRYTSTVANSQIYEVAYHNGKYIAVGVGNVSGVNVPIAISSTNGTTWAVSPTPPNVNGKDLRSIAAGNGVWICSSANAGKPQRSTDGGLTWNEITSIPFTQFEGCAHVVYGSGIFMAQPSSIYQSNVGRIFVSFDTGLTWELQDTKIAYGYVGHDRGLWVYCGYSNESGISISRQSNINTTGLVLYVDAANAVSYPPPRTGTVWYDTSGNNNNGNFVRNVTWQSSDNGRMNINGPTKSYISFPNTSSLQFGSVFTVQAWIRPTFLGARHSIFSTRLAGSGGGFSFECGTNEAGTNRIGVSGVGTWIYRSQNNVVALNDWTNVCYVRNGSSQAMYVNGELITPASTAAYTITNNAANKTIGIGNIETTEFFGQIAKVLVYNRALEAQEVKDNYGAHRTLYQPTSV